MPPPFPEDFNKSTATSMDFATLRLMRPECMMVNASVTILSWLAVGKEPCCPPEPHIGSTLSGAQAAAVQRLIAPIECAAALGRVEVSGLGRAAERLTGVDSTLDALAAEAQALRPVLAPYAGGRLWHQPVAEAELPHLVGLASTIAAKPLDPSRLTFSGQPSFDPRPLYDEATSRPRGPGHAQT
jgi:hypothetical protein